jgi:hypothetical protein
MAPAVPTLSPGALQDRKATVLPERPEARPNPTAATPLFVVGGRKELAPFVADQVFRCSFGCPGPHGWPEDQLLGAGRTAGADQGLPCPQDLRGRRALLLRQAQSQRCPQYATSTRRIVPASSDSSTRSGCPPGIANGRQRHSRRIERLASGTRRGYTGGDIFLEDSHGLPRPSGQDQSRRPGCFQR